MVRTLDQEFAWSHIKSTISAFYQMKHLFHIPDEPALQQHLSLIWEVEGVPLYRSETVLPRGYIEIIFNFDEDVAYRNSNNKFFKKAPLCSIQGFNISPVQATYQKHHHFFGLRLKPSAIRALLGINPGEITEQVIDLTLIDKSFLTLWHQLAECSSFTEKIAIIRPVFERLLPESDRRTRFFNHFFGTTGSFSGFRSVSDFADLFCLSERQLQRKTCDVFGLSPNELLRYLRFTTAVKLIHQNQLPLSRIAYESGFFDQSHFIKVFRSFSNLTPKAYRKEMGALPFHIYK